VKLLPHLEISLTRVPCCFLRCYSDACTAILERVSNASEASDHNNEISSSNKSSISSIASLNRSVRGNHVKHRKPFTQRGTARSFIPKSWMQGKSVVSQAQLEADEAAAEAERNARERDMYTASVRFRANVGREEQRSVLQCSTFVLQQHRTFRFFAVVALCTRARCRSTAA
jgi:hypothetical protein